MRQGYQSPPHCLAQKLNLNHHQAVQQQIKMSFLKESLPNFWASTHPGFVFPPLASTTPCCLVLVLLLNIGEAQGSVTIHPQMYVTSLSNHTLYYSSQYQLKTGGSKNCISYLTSLGLQFHKLIT